MSINSENEAGMTMKNMILTVVVILTMAGAAQAEFSRACRAHGMTRYIVDQFSGEEVVRAGTGLGKSGGAFDNPAGVLGARFMYYLEAHSDGTAFVLLRRFGTYEPAPGAPVMVKGNGEVYELQPVDKYFYDGATFAATHDAMAAFVAADAVRIELADGEVVTTKSKAKRRKLRRLQAWVDACVAGE